MRARELAQALRVHVRRAEQRDLAGSLQLGEPLHRFDIPCNAVVPPVELRDVELLHAQARERGVDDAREIGARQLRQRFEVGHDFRRNAQAPRLLRVAAPEFADQRLDADVVIGTIEERHAGVDKGAHVVDGAISIEGRAVALRELPVALGDPRHAHTVAEVDVVR